MRCPHFIEPADRTSTPLQRPRAVQPVPRHSFLLPAGERKPGDPSRLIQTLDHSSALGVLSSPPQLPPEPGKRPHARPGLDPVIVPLALAARLQTLLRRPARLVPQNRMSAVLACHQAEAAFMTSSRS
jgi:hypothetical protein